MTYVYSDNFFFYIVGANKQVCYNILSDYMFSANQLNVQVKVKEAVARKSPLHHQPKLACSFL